jgi:hypothetical protein
MLDFQRFQRGDDVEVLDTIRNIWMPAKFVLRWVEVDIPSGERRVAYEVEGLDAFGSFHGKFDSQHIRKPGTANEQPPGSPTPAGGKQKA